MCDGEKLLFVHASFAADELFSAPVNRVFYVYIRLLRANDDYFAIASVRGYLHGSFLRCFTRLKRKVALILILFRAKGKKNHPIFMKFCILTRYDTSTYFGKNKKKNVKL